MLARIRFFFKLASYLAAFRKSQLYEELGLKVEAKLISVRRNTSRPHVLFRTIRISDSVPVLIKMVPVAGDDSMEREWEAFKFISSQKPSGPGFRYPKVLGFDRDVPFLAIEMVAGKRLLDMDDLFQTPQMRRDVLARLVSWQANLQEIEITPPSEDYNELDWVQRDMDEISKAYPIKKQYVPICEALKARTLEITKVQPKIALEDIVLVHGDFHLGNVFLPDGPAGEVEVIDFALKGKGTKESDLGEFVFHAWAFKGFDPEELRSEILELAPHLDADRLRYEFDRTALHWAFAKLATAQSRVGELPDSVKDIIERICAKYDVDTKGAL